jgi:hypothetical protein
MKNIVALCLLSGIFVAACRKSEGQGGTSTIQGKIFIQDYNSSGNLQSVYFAPDEDVYLIYGQDSVFGERTRTSYQGLYRFEGLQPGDYQVYAYSKCSNCPSAVSATILSVNIPNKGEFLEVSTITLTK